MAEAVLEQLEAPVIDEDGVATQESQNQDPNKHPLLNEDVLDKIFPYFTDSSDLGSFRLANKTWNTSASRTVKKEILWKISPPMQCERRFMEVMSKYAVKPGEVGESNENIFQNFWWTNNDKIPFLANLTFFNISGVTSNSSDHNLMENLDREHVQKFLEQFGPQIVNLRLRAADPVFIKHRLRSSYLPNLEHLELYDISAAVMKEEAFDEIQCFPKLKSICLTPKDFYWRQFREMREYEKAKGLIYEKILETAPNLTKLDINVPTILNRILKEPEALALERLSAITSFKMARPLRPLDPNGFLILALDPIEFQNLLESCPHLKVLCVTIFGMVKQEVVCDILAKSKVCVHLEELDLVIDNFMISADVDDNRRLVFYKFGSYSSGSSSDSEDETDFNPSSAKKNKTKKPAPCPLPALPKLKKLRLQNWCLQDFDIFYNTPNLLYVDLFLINSNCIIDPDFTVLGHNMNVKYLKLRGIFRVGISGHGMEKFSTLFPNLKELDVKLYEDEHLEAIFKHMQKLKRLNLSDSPRRNEGTDEGTDEGITGISRKKLEENFANAFTLEQVARGEKFFIGDLKDLQQFTYTGHTLTNLSIQYGIAALKNLTNFKFTPWRTGHRFSMADSRQGPSRPSTARTSNEPVDIRPLLTNCEYLVKMDVNRTFPEEQQEDDDLEEEKPIKTGFKGCGLTSEVIALVKEKFPNLDLVYGEVEPPA